MEISILSVLQRRIESTIFFIYGNYYYYASEMFLSCVFEILDRTGEIIGKFDTFFQCPRSHI